MLKLGQKRVLTLVAAARHNLPLLVEVEILQNGKDIRRPMGWNEANCVARGAEQYVLER